MEMNYRAAAIAAAAQHPAGDRARYPLYLPAPDVLRGPETQIGKALMAVDVRSGTFIHPQIKVGAGTGETYWERGVDEVWRSSSYSIYGTWHGRQQTLVATGDTLLHLEAAYRAVRAALNARGLATEE